MGITYQAGFDAQLAALGGELDRLYDALRYVEYQISESPASGAQTVVPGIYRARTRLPSGKDGVMIRVSIFYTFDGRDSTFQRIVQSPHD